MNQSAFGVVHKLDNPVRGQRAARLAMNLTMKGKKDAAARAKKIWEKNQVSKHGPVGVGMLPAAYVSTAVRSAKAIPGAVRQGKKSARMGKKGRLEMKQKAGANFRATGGRPDEAFSRPAPWARKSRAAWDRGYSGG